MEYFLFSVFLTHHKNVATSSFLKSTLYSALEWIIFKKLYTRRKLFTTPGKQVQIRMLNNVSFWQLQYNRGVGGGGV